MQCDFAYRIATFARIIVDYYLALSRFICIRIRSIDQYDVTFDQRQYGYRKVVLQINNDLVFTVKKMKWILEFIPKMKL